MPEGNPEAYFTPQNVSGGTQQQFELARYMQERMLLDKMRLQANGPQAMPNMAPEIDRGSIIPEDVLQAALAQEDMRLEKQKAVGKQLGAAAFEGAGEGRNLKQDMQPFEIEMADDQGKWVREKASGRRFFIPEYGVIAGEPMEIPQNTPYNDPEVRQLAGLEMSPGDQEMLAERQFFKDEKAMQKEARAKPRQGAGGKKLARGKGPGKSKRMAAGKGSPANFREAIRSMSPEELAEVRQLLGVTPQPK